MSRGRNFANVVAMIVLEILIEIVVELIALLIELSALTLELMAEGAMMVVEFLIMLFGGTRKFKRLKLRRPRTPVAEVTARQKISRRGAVCLALFLVFAGYSTYRLSTRTIRVTAEDGTPAALAKFVWENENRTRYARTNLRGDLELPRFGVREVWIQDSRYEPRSWKGGLPDKVALKRTALGKTADALLSPAMSK